MIAGLGMNEVWGTSALAACLGIAWGIRMLRRKTTIAELLGYMAFWAVAIAVVAWLWEQPIF
jgi:hypothetical protein